MKVDEGERGTLVQNTDSDSAERAFLRDLLTQSFLLGILTWSSTPVTYAVAWFMQPEFAYAFILLKACVVGYWEQQILQQIVCWLQQSPGDNMPHWRRALHTGDLGLFAKLAAWLSFIPDLLEAIDPDLDVLNAANSRTSLREESAFADQWADYPLISKLGFFYTFNGFIFACLIYQVAWFVSGYLDAIKEVDRWPNSKAEQPSRQRSGFLNDYHGLMDVAGLLVVASALRKLQGAEDVIPINRGRSFITRIFPESVLSCWFTVSLLSLAILNSNWSNVFSAQFSTATSLLSITRGLYGIPALLKWHWSQSDKARNLCRLWMYSCISAFVFLSTVAVTVSNVGIWRCQSHVFQLTSFACDAKAG